jgi:hypothetical protein
MIDIFFFIGCYFGFVWALLILKGGINVTPWWDFGFTVPLIFSWTFMMLGRYDSFEYGMYIGLGMALTAIPLSFLGMIVSGVMALISHINVKVLRSTSTNYLLQRYKHYLLFHP